MGEKERECGEEVLTMELEMVRKDIRWGKRVLLESDEEGT